MQRHRQYIVTADRGATPITTPMAPSARHAAESVRSCTKLGEVVQVIGNGLKRPRYYAVGALGVVRVRDWDGQPVAE